LTYRTATAKALKPHELEGLGAYGLSASPSCWAEIITPKEPPGRTIPGSRILCLMWERLHEFIHGNEHQAGVFIAALIVAVLLIGGVLDSLLVRQERDRPKQ